MSYYGFPKYVSVAEKKTKAEKKLKQLKKKNPGMRPVIIKGKALATTWWGKAWNKNLERYADYSNRIGRGRSYVRHSAVLDLQIKPGKAEALVQGSASKPYKVVIDIKSIPGKNWGVIKQCCKGKMNSLKQLLAGKFPKELESVFTQKGDGLFPMPMEINFDCSCPDGASMCKHVAATLYGLGARLDEDPNLFFKLRKVNINDLIAETVKESKKELLSKAEKKSSRVIGNESGLSSLFGIDIDDNTLSDKPVKKVVTKIVKTKKITTQKALAGTTASKPAKTTNKKTGESESIEQIIHKQKQGITVLEIIEKSGLAPQKVRNIVYRLKSQGKIENIKRGIYKGVLNL
jgi:uncharacterized Zn finger protein